MYREPGRVDAAPAKPILKCERCGAEHPAETMKSARLNGSDGILCWECAGVLRDRAGLKFVNTAAFVLLGLVAMIFLAAVVLLSGLWRF